MLQYFIRRILIAIPTFLVCTVIVFVIVQLTPGGPVEQQIQALKAGSAGERGGGREGSDAAIPPSVKAELERYYQFDKPLPVRYLMWLGFWPRPVSTKDVPVELGVPRSAGGGEQIVVRREGDQLVVRRAGTNEILPEWHTEQKELEDKSIQIRAFQQEYAGILTGYFGRSNRYQEDVMDLVLKRMPISAQFGILGIVMSYAICIYLGIQKALRHGSAFDVVSSGLVFIAYSIPGFALGAVLLVLFSTETGWNILPLRGFQSLDYDNLEIGSKILDRMQHFVLPTVAYTIGGFASLTLLMKNSLLDNLSQDYVRTAFAKGIRGQRVIWLHAMRNSIIPIASRLGTIISIFLASSYLVEFVFGIDGLGMLSFQAILQRDYPVVFAFTVINVVVILIGSILSDFILALVDPRIKFK